MPSRRPVNTERGSRVALHKRQQHDAFHALFVEATSTTSMTTSLRQLALRHHVNYLSVTRRMKKYREARDRGMSGADAIGVACSDNRGGHNRTFSRDHETLFASIVRAAVPAMTQPQIAIAALQLRQSIEVGHPQTRARTSTMCHHLGFVASSRFVTRFKRAHCLSSHRTAVIHHPRPSPTVDRDLIHHHVPDDHCFRPSSATQRHHRR